MKKTKEQDKSICNVAKNYILKNGINNTDKHNQPNKSSNTSDNSISSAIENNSNISE